MLLLTKKNKKQKGTKQTKGTLLNGSNHIHRQHESTNQKDRICSHEFWHSVWFFPHLRLHLNSCLHGTVWRVYGFLAFNHTNLLNNCKGSFPPWYKSINHTTTAWRKILTIPSSTPAAQQNVPAECAKVHPSLSLPRHSTEVCSRWWRFVSYWPTALQEPTGDLSYIRIHITWGQTIGWGWGGSLLECSQE